MSKFQSRPGVTSRMRLRNWDYSSPDLYFVTICVNDWSHRFGEVVDSVFVPNAAGQMVSSLWVELPERFPGASLDYWCVMPNHFHGVVGIGIEDGAPSLLPSLSRIMNWFKSASTVEYIRGVKELGWPRFQDRLWLAKFHDRVIRDERELDRIRDYIASNPAQWHRDGFFRR